jgi:signal transduction histidine kinase
MCITRKISRHAMVFGYISIALLSLVIVVFSIYSINKIRKESDFIIRTILPARISSMEILTSLINQETGIRAYIISQDKAFLQPYYLERNSMQGYYDSFEKIKYTELNVDTANQLSQQMIIIQRFFEQQIDLIDNGKIYEAKINLNQGKKLVDKFRLINNVLLNKIELDVSSSQEKVGNTQLIYLYVLIFLGVILIFVNFIFIRFIMNDRHNEVRKIDEVNRELEKLLLTKEEFIANISHELKTPLNVIFSAVQLIQLYCYNGSLDENREIIIEYIESMKLNTYRLSKLVNNIVDSSKIKAGVFKLNLSNNNIVVVVENIVMSVVDFSKSKGINIIFDTDIEEKVIACDPENIERVMLNLISNAIKFSNEGKEIFVKIQEKGEFLEISVKDYGIGIQESYIDLIFDRFKQVNKSLSRSAEGTGIGLNLTKCIIELHGGDIFVNSEIGIGSEFTFTLPSKIVTGEKALLNNIFKNKNELVQLEFSDIYR